MIKSGINIIRNLMFPYKEGLPKELIGCNLVVDPERPWLALLAQPLEIVAPSTADPLFCYLDTVIFYERPTRIVDGGNFAEHGRVRLGTQIDDVVDTPAGTFVVKAGRVRWTIDRWEILWTLRRTEADT